MSPQSRSPDAHRFRWRRSSRAWWLGGAIFALTPKCALCVLAYLGLGATGGLGAREWCGTTSGNASFLPTVAAWLGFAGLFALLLRHIMCAGGTRGATATRSRAPQSREGSR